ncbi:MAG: hypothetical protein COB66_07435 [Coxiella sp. (in: Bacteria)]|nr:MAG: hypothetical protein COB66_07435 [Coxiella sp. (in: g-proteobacteria)]
MSGGNEGAQQFKRVGIRTQPPPLARAMTPSPLLFVMSAAREWFIPELAVTAITRNPDIALYCSKAGVPAAVGYAFYTTEDDLLYCLIQREAGVLDKPICIYGFDADTRACYLTPGLEHSTAFANEHLHGLMCLNKESADVVQKASVSEGAGESTEAESPLASLRTSFS